MPWGYSSRVASLIASECGGDLPWPSCCGASEPSPMRWRTGSHGSVFDRCSGTSIDSLAEWSGGGLAVARLVLGLGEAGNFPASIKTVAEWFPRNERAFATGLFNSGTNIGAVLTPILVPIITRYWGWEWAFIVTGSLGFFWVVAWLICYAPPERHPRVTSAELAIIRSDPPEVYASVPWRRLFPLRQTWPLGSASS